jgi:AcrR family transcriptional regulator
VIDLFYSRNPLFREDLTIDKDTIFLIIKTEQSVFIIRKIKQMPKVTFQYEEARKRNILDGAAGVFAQKGYQQTTIDDIATSLKMSKGAIYLYFKTKEDLYVSVLETIYERRFVTLSTAYEENDSITVKFEKIMNRLGSLVNHDDYVFIRLSLEGYLESEHIPRLQTIKTESHQHFYNFINGLLQEGQLSGQINRDLNLPSVTAAIMAVADGLMLHSLVESWGINPERVRRIVHDTFSQIIENHPE